MKAIGDVHGKIHEYQRIIENEKGPTVQLGDFGFHEAHTWHINNVNPSRHKVLFGNHDDYRFLESAHSLRDWYVGGGFMSVRGAMSVDRSQRIEGIDWFREEELSYLKMREAIEVAMEVRPTVIFSHDCPTEVRRALFGIRETTATSNGLQALFEAYQPHTWVFGHHHKSRNEKINGVRFICLAELEVKEIF